MSFQMKEARKSSTVHARYSLHRQRRRWFH